MKFDVTMEDATGLVEPVTVRVNAPEGATLLDLREALSPFQPIDGPLFIDGRPLDDTPLAEVERLHASVVSIGQPRPASSIAVRGPRIHVETGPVSGMVVPFEGAELTLGRSSDNDVVLKDASVSRRHAVIGKTADGYSVGDLGSLNGTALRGVRVEGEPAALEVDEPVAVGASVVSVQIDTAPDLALSPAGDGVVRMTRPFRNSPTLAPTTITLPRPPGEDESRSIPIPWIALAVPLVLGVGLVAYSGNIQFGLFALMGPIMMGATSAASRRAASRQSQRRHGRHASEMAEAETATSEAVRRETVHRRALHPDAAAITEICCGPTGRLWERRRQDEDFLRVAVGTAALPANAIMFEGEGAKKNGPPVIPDAPVTLDLAALGVVGVHGPHSATRAVARNLVLQVTGLHGPDEVRIIVLARDAARHDWEWLRWLPHSRTVDGVATAGIDEETRRARLTEIASIITERQKARESAGGRDTRFFPAYVLVAEDVHVSRAHPAVVALLAQGPDVDVFTICLEPTRARLPQECKAAIGAEDDSANQRCAAIEFEDRPRIADVNLSLVSPSIAERCARSMASIALGDSDTSGANNWGFDGTVRLLDLLGARAASPSAIRAMWESGGRTTRCVVGVTGSGPFHIDLAKDGPHGLVAGTTGAGKSQFLMTLVTSLAFSNSPEDLNFVLVDFKGGGAFEACRDLPHTTGLVTNLSGGGAQRAIRSLRAEALRRQALFAPFAGDIDVYEQTRRRHPGQGLEKVPRLIIVVDEFAQLAKNHEGLMREFVDVAQIGRSLGMNMILATQRPAGVVTGQIQSNTELRIALRVAEPGDSMDVIGVPLAARLPKSRPGRAHVQTADGLHEVQTAAVGLPRPDVDQRLTGIDVQPAAWADVTRPPADASRTRSTTDPTDTDLYAAVHLIREAAMSAGCRIPPPPFRPELPTRIAVDTLDAPEAIGSNGLAVPIGLEDRPLEQDQRPYMFDPSGPGLLLPGSPRSGRTTAVRTIVGQLARHLGAADLHLYVIDFGGSLRAVKDLPQCGAVIRPNQPQRALRLIEQLESMIRSRADLFESLGVSDIVEQRDMGVNPLPFVVVLVDGWHLLYERRTSGFGGVVDALVRIARDGRVAGISVVAAGEARACSVLTGSIGEQAVLAQNTPGEVEYFGLKARDVPEDVPPGLAFRGGEGTAVRLAMLAADTSGTAQNEMLAAIIAQASERDLRVPEHLLPLRVDEIPVRLDFPEALALDNASAGRRGPILVGVGGDRIAAQWIDPRVDGPGFVVVGPAGSGRTTSLMAMAESLQRAEIPFAVIAPGKSALTQLAATVVLSGADGERPSADDLSPVTEAGGVILLDDADMIADDSTLLAYLADARSGGVIAAGSRDWIRGLRGLAPALIRSRNGLLLLPQTPSDGSPLGLTLRSDDCFNDPKGRGVLARSGEALIIQVPLPTMAAV